MNGHTSAGTALQMDTKLRGQGRNGQNCDFTAMLMMKFQAKSYCFFPPQNPTTLTRVGRGEGGKTAPALPSTCHLGG
jgi:hypothetical protein